MMPITKIALSLVDPCPLPPHRTLVLFCGMLGLPLHTHTQTSSYPPTGGAAWYTPARRSNTIQ